ncbi:MAG: hypothetical protein IPG88_16605 [Gemmatimonadetes bacterium]|nr:hypothetical protein [Gemmatimonadota bacterium]
MPAPSIVDYRPRNTLKAPAHTVPKAKFPAIDYHGHPTSQLSPAEGLNELARALDALNVRVMVAANNVSGESLKRQVALVKGSARMKDRVRFLTGIDFRNVGPGWAEKAIAQLEADVAAGAVGIGEIGKGLGLSNKKRATARASDRRPDLDPRLAGRRAPQAPGLHPHRRPAGSSGRRSTTRTSAGSSSRCSRAAVSGRAVSVVRDADDRA